MTPRARIIVDNDFAGDPDGLFQLAHHVLCTSVEVVLVIASKLPDAMTAEHPDAVAEGVEAADDVLELAGSPLRTVAGSLTALSPGHLPEPSDATELIIREAMRDDTDARLYFAAGAGLTELATAYLHEPRIAERLTLVWIGGHGYDSAAEGAGGAEFNLSADIAAAQVVFDSPIPIWQVPEPTYAQCVVSWAELERDVETLGSLGGHLTRRWREFTRRIERMLGANLGETAILGDSPLVLLTALQASFRADAVSSFSEYRPRPRITDGGGYGEPRVGASEVRVFTRLDTRLMYGDLVAKLARHAARPTG